MAKRRAPGPGQRRRAGGGGNDAEAKFAQAVRAFQKGDFRLARKILQRLEKTFGAVPEIIHLKGFVELELGNLGTAIKALTAARAAMPGDVNLVNALGAAQRRSGDPAAAAEAFRQAAAMAPDRPDILANLGNALGDMGDRRAAVDAYDRALALDPAMADTRRALVADLMVLGDHDRVREELDVLLTQDPDDAWALLHLGREDAVSFRLDEARRRFGRLLELDPEDWDARLGLAAMDVSAGRVAEGLAAFDRARKSVPDAPYPAAAFALNMNYLPATGSGDLLAAAREWGRTFALPPVKRRPAQTSGGGGALRVGILSGKLGWHPCGQFLAPFLRHADPARIAVELFAKEVRAHPLAEDLRAHAAAWHDVSRLDGAATLELLTARGLDVLISPTGLEEGELLQLFTARAAPVQAVGFAHFMTTGLEAMDLILADRFHVPEGAEGGYAETVLRLPGSYISYMPPPYLPALGGASADRGGPLTFGCFNALAKLCDGTLALWAKVLAAAPQGSRLVLRAGPLADDGVRRDLAARFRHAGGDPDCLDLRPGAPHRELLETYNEIDLALDPLPYSGGLTTLEALWMGVPVVTLPGETFARRHTLSHLSNCGLAAFVAGDADEYVRIAAGFPDVMAAAGLDRAGVRAAIQGSPISDARAHAEALTDALTAAVADAAI